MFNQLRFVWLPAFYIMLMVPCANATDGQDTYHDPVHRERLRQLRNKAGEQAKNRMNRAGLQLLRDYNILSDSLFAKESSDTVDAYEQLYDRMAAGPLGEMERIRQTVEDAELQRIAARNRFFSLFHKSLYALAVWLILVIYLLRKRSASVKSATADVSHVRGQLDSTTTTYREGQEAMSGFRKLYDEFHPVAVAGIPVIGSLKTAAGESKEELSLVQKSEQQWIREDSIVTHLADLDHEDAAEKSMRNMNDLCDRYLEIAYRGVCLNPAHPFNCTVTRDLEKNMQPIGIFPESAGVALLNVFDNALLAVRNRAAREEKGYVPTVSVSTRILPRFVQVRVKDNGDGMTDEVREKAMNEFYSIRPEGEGAGLGLSEAKRILTDLHKGEIVIESEVGRGTDIYLKFYR